MLFPGGMPAGDYLFHYPLMEWLPGVDLVIGPCGYHLCHETAALGSDDELRHWVDVGLAYARSLPPK